MRVLSVRQPYASLLLLSVKRFEARTWKTDYRGPILIHASSGSVTTPAIDALVADRDVFAEFAKIGWKTDSAIKGLPRSAIIGQVNVVDIVPSEESNDATDLDCRLAAVPDPDTYFWCVEQPIAFEPVPINGKLNLWTLPSELESVIQDAIDAPGKGAPAWMKRAETGGNILLLKEFKPIGAMQHILPQDATTPNEIMEFLLNYAHERGLETPQRIRLDESLQFLAPDRKTLGKDDFFSAAGEYFILES